MILTLPAARNCFLELAGSSRVYVSRAILIQCEAAGSVSITDPPQSLSSGSHFDPLTYGNGACPLRHLH